MIYYRECAICGEKIKMESPTSWRYKLVEDEKKQYYCGYKCYSQVFDSKWKASTITRHTTLGYKTDKTLR